MTRGNGAKSQLVPRNPITRAISLAFPGFFLSLSSLTHSLSLIKIPIFKANVKPLFSISLSASHIPHSVRFTPPEEMASVRKRTQAPKPVNPKRKRSKSKQEEADDYSETRCEKCGSGQHPAELLLCDKCDCGFHLFCLRPVIVAVPEGCWFCPSCSNNKNPTGMVMGGLDYLFWFWGIVLGFLLFGWLNENLENGFCFYVSLCLLPDFPFVKVLFVESYVIRFGVSALAILLYRQYVCIGLQPII